MGMLRGGLIWGGAACMGTGAAGAQVGEPAGSESEAQSVWSWVCAQAEHAEARVRETAARAGVAAAEAEEWVRGELEETRARAREKSEARWGVFAYEAGGREEWRRVFGLGSAGAEGGAAQVTVPGESGEASAVEEKGRSERLGERVVVLVHGLDEAGSIWEDVAPALAAAGHAVVRFDYPNDQGLAASAGMLEGALKTLKARGVERVELVCHSMGGLIARDALTRAAYAGEWGDEADAGAGGRENPGRDGGADDAGRAGGGEMPRVERLVTIGTPNHGCAWARLRVVMEAREHAVRAMEAGALGEVSSWIGGAWDGDGQAGKDLMPGSWYLEELNGRGLPRGVTMTVIAGRMAEAGEGGVGRAIEWLEGEGVMSKAAAREASAWVERQAGRIGDGPVTLESARLDGVSDFVVLPEDHRGLIRRLRVSVGDGWAWEEEETPPGIGVILERLRE